MSREAIESGLPYGIRQSLAVPDCLNEIGVAAQAG